MTDAPPELPTTRRQLREKQKPTRRSAVPAPAYANSRKQSGIAHRLFSAMALLFAGALAIGTSIPANAFLSADAATIAFASNQGTQDAAVSADAAGDDVARAKYSITDAVQQIVGAQGGRYTPTTGAVRWPFPYATTITDGFGPRKSPCAGCSTFHKGTDFVPGAGIPTFSIAAGTVESSVISNAGLGNEVIINNGTINGHVIQSVYGHLQMNSSPLKAGDTVKVGDLVGKVGATGTTTGANMHLEVHVDGVAVDAFAWLTKNATNND